MIPIGTLILVGFMPPGSREFPPTSYTIDNYVYVIGYLHFLQNMFNAFLFITIAVIISLAIAVPAAYGLARLRINYGIWALTLSLAILAKSLPPGSLLVPMYDFLWKLGLTNTPLGVAIGYQVYTLPYSI
ncbi:MAG: hypothetical protein ABWK01_01420 [Infirmifilum sp.]